MFLSGVCCSRSSDRFLEFHEKFYMKMLESLRSVEIKYFYVVGLHKKSSNCEPFVTRFP